MAVEACSSALRAVLDNREEGIDTKTLKDVTAALKDLNGIGTLGEGTDRTVTVRFENGAEEAAQ